MGRHARHRRTAAADRTGSDPADRRTRAERGDDGPSGEPHGPRQSGRRPARSAVRTGLLGVSAAVAMGAVAVASGALPGGDSYSVGSGPGPEDVRPLDTSTAPGPDGGVTGTASPAPGRSATGGDGSGRGKPSPARSGDSRAHRPGDGPAGSDGGATQPDGPTQPPRQETPQKAPSDTETTPSGTSTIESTDPAEDAAARRVLTLVNKERGAAGCSALRTDDRLTGLAKSFSKQMDDEDFFDHTDPEGRSPWDRAAKHGISDLGGENIARGQTTATAVMDAWMKSKGHRANILNCDYHTIGIGVHMGEGGPWWTQDFGF